MLFTSRKASKGLKTAVAAKQKTDENTRSIDTNNDRLDTLEKDFKRLTIMTESLWELLKQETTLDDDALLKKVDEINSIIEAQSNTKIRCPACRQSVPANKKSCYYCGKKLITEETSKPFGQ